MAQRPSRINISQQQEKVIEPSGEISGARSGRGKKLSYKDQRELDTLPARIESLENEQARLQDLMASADFYRGDKAEITRNLARAEQLKHELEEAYGRWQALDTMAAAVK